MLLTQAHPPNRYEEQFIPGVTHTETRKFSVSVGSTQTCPNQQKYKKQTSQIGTLKAVGKPRTVDKRGIHLVLFLHCPVHEHSQYMQI